MSKRMGDEEQIPHRQEAGWTPRPRCDRAPRATARLEQTLRPELLGAASRPVRSKHDGCPVQFGEPLHRQTLRLDTYCEAFRSATKTSILRQWHSRITVEALAFDSVRSWPRKPNAGQLLSHVIAAIGEWRCGEARHDSANGLRAPMPLIEVDSGVLHRKVAAALVERHCQVVYGPALPRLYR